MKYPRCNNGTATQSQRPCWTGTKGKVTTFLDESSLWTKPGLAHTNLTWKPGSSHSKSVHPTQWAVKVMFIVAYDIDGVILYYGIPSRQTLNVAYYFTSLHTTFVQRSGENDDTWLYRTLQGVTPLLLSRTSCPASNGRFWSIHRTHPMSPLDYDLFAKVKEPLREDR